MARSRYVQIDGRLIEVFSDSTNSSIQELSEVVDDYADKLSAQPPPATLYHYTDASGFKGILESGTLWFTDIFSLNDTSELKHGVEVACQLLDKASSRADCEYDWKSNSTVSLNHVVIGPATDRKSAIRFVEECRKRFLPVGHTIEVTQSKLPYRSASR